MVFQEIGFSVNRVSTQLIIPAGPPFYYTLCSLFPVKGIATKPRKGWDRFWRLYDLFKDRGDSVDDVSLLVNWDGSVKNFHTRTIEHNEWFVYAFDHAFYLGVDPDTWGAAQKEYNAAWIAYAEAVRRLCLERQEAKLEAERSAREAARRARPEPEIPTHLLEEEEQP